jgi:ankyrin repeat protein
MSACEAGDSAAAKTLLKHGARVELRDKKGHTALWLAMQQKSADDLISILKKAGAAQ